MPAVVIRPILASQTYSLRHRVLWPDKPPEYVQLPEDEVGQHFGAFRQQELVAVISLFVENEVGRFRKFATEPALQGQGIGTALLRHVVAEATRLGARTLWCDSRQAAADFYRRFNMEPEGAAFYKGDIPYIRMVRTLP